MDNSYAAQHIEAMFAKILGKLDGIERQLNEIHYPLEETFKHEFLEQVKTAEKDIANGKCLEFESMDDFFGSIEG